MESISTLLLDHDTAVRVGSFLALLVAFGITEMLFPRLIHKGNKAVRWTSNLGLSLINSIVLRLAFPILAMGVAEVASQRGWGLFNHFNVPYVAAFMGTILAFDFVIYLQHAVFHHVPWLWRLHRVHHSDIDLDVSSAVRFHFVEIMLSMGIKLATVVVLGAPILAVLAFEVWLNATSSFHHSNLRIPTKVDRWLRWFVVTPDMHRVHHSAVIEEANSNFAFNLPWWDWLLGTYLAQPRAGHEGMTIGLEEFREPRDQHIDRLLLQPFVGEQRESEKRAEFVPPPSAVNVNG